MARSRAIVATSTSNVARVVRYLAIARRAAQGQGDDLLESSVSASIPKKRQRIPPLLFLDLDNCGYGWTYHGCSFVQPPPGACGDAEEWSSNAEFHTTDDVRLKSSVANRPLKMALRREPCDSNITVEAQPLSKHGTGTGKRTIQNQATANKMSRDLAQRCLSAMVTTRRTDQDDATSEA